MISVIVPFRSDGGHRDALWGWVRRWWEVHFPDAQISVGDSGHEPFNRGASRNAAARAARGGVFVIADADTFAEPDAVREGIELVATGVAPWVIPYDGPPDGRYYNLSESATARRLRFEPDAAVPIAEPWDRDDYEFKLVSWAGCLIVSAAGYWAAGGYPELELWGYEDSAYRAALDVMVGEHWRLHGFCAHLWHPAVESDRFNNPQIEANRAVFMEYTRARTPQQMAEVISRRAPGR